MLDVALLKGCCCHWLGLAVVNVSDILYGVCIFMHMSQSNVLLADSVLGDVLKADSLQGDRWRCPCFEAYSIVLGARVQLRTSIHF